MAVLRQDQVECYLEILTLLGVKVFSHWYPIRACVTRDRDTLWLLCCCWLSPRHPKNFVSAVPRALQCHLVRNGLPSKQSLGRALQEVQGLEPYPHGVPSSCRVQEAALFGVGVGTHILARSLPRQDAGPRASPDPCTGRSRPS